MTTSSSSVPGRRKPGTRFDAASHRALRRPGARELAKIATAETAKRGPDPKPTTPPAPVVAAAAPARPDPAMPASPAGPAPGDVVWMLQTELKRVGCYSGAISGDWNATSRRALDAFNRNAGAKFDTKIATLDVLGAVRDLQRRVCPLECGRGLRANGEECVKITCDSGYVIGDNGACERVKDRSRSVSPAPSAPPVQRAAPAAPAAPAKRQAPVRQAGTPPRRGGSPQVACDTVRLPTGQEGLFGQDVDLQGRDATERRL